MHELNTLGNLQNMKIIAQKIQTNAQKIEQT